MPTPLQDALWLLFPALQAGLMFLMWRGGWHRQMPMFFSYNIFGAIRGPIFFFVLHWIRTDAYFYIFWSTQPLQELLVFANIYELFGGMFRHREGLKDFGSMLFRWAIVVMLLMGAVLAASSAGMTGNQFMRAVLSLERSIHLIMLGLLLFLLAFSKHLGISWRHRTFGIVIGWGLTSLVELTLYIGRTSFRMSSK